MATEMHNLLHLKKKEKADILTSCLGGKGQNWQLKGAKMSVTSQSLKATFLDLDCPLKGPPALTITTN